MTAEIIQFGKPQSAAVRPRQHAPVPSDKSVRSRAPRVSETVRFTFGSWLYEAKFCGDHVKEVNAIQYRITAGGVQEMKRSNWWEGCYSRHDPDPAMIEAAKRARASGGKDADIPFREAALAAFHKRRAKLISEVEKIDATLASMQYN
jgi:hypothetical protein